VPFSDEVTEPPGVPLTDKVADRVPVAVGAKWTLTEQAPPAGSAVVHVLASTAKSEMFAPVTRTLSGPDALCPVLVTAND
jgi:hypothetical protein